MKPVVFHEEAVAEMDEAMDYYEIRREGLGLDFLAEVRKSTALIEEFPRIGAQYKSTHFRHYVLRRFPFVIFYTELSDAIWIVAVAHGKRKPRYWRNRKISPPTSV